jgi:hypothetical protein
LQVIEKERTAFNRAGPVFLFVLIPAAKEGAAKEDDE